MGQFSTGRWVSFQLALTGAASKAAEKGAEAAFIAASVTLLSQAVAGPLVAIGATLVGKFVENLLKEADQNGRLLQLLASEPYKTGARAVRVALTLNPTTEDVARFRTDRLRFATEKLETALTLATDDPEQRIYVLFLLGMSEMWIPGAAQMAAMRFSEVGELVQKQIAESEERLNAIGRLEPLPDAATVRLAYEGLMECRDRGYISTPETTMRRAHEEQERLIELRAPVEAERRALQALHSMSIALRDQAGRSTGSPLRRPCQQG